MWIWHNTAFCPSSGENITFSISTFYCTCQRLCINIYAAKGNQDSRSTTIVVVWSEPKIGPDQTKSFTPEGTLLAEKICYYYELLL